MEKSHIGARHTKCYLWEVNIVSTDDLMPTGESICRQNVDIQYIIHIWPWSHTVCSCSGVCKHHIISRLDDDFLFWHEWQYLIEVGIDQHWVSWWSGTCWCQIISWRNADNLHWYEAGIVAFIPWMSFQVDFPSLTYNNSNDLNQYCHQLVPIVNTVQHGPHYAL